MITKTLYPIAFQSPITDVTQLTLQHPSTVLHKVLLYKQKRRISPQMYYKRQKKERRKNAFWITKISIYPLYRKHSTNDRSLLILRLFIAPDL